MGDRRRAGGGTDHHLEKVFNRVAKHASAGTGRPSAFALAVTIIVVWAITGPAFGFNDTWQLVINTGTTIVTFLMVFLIQNSQNRDTEALHLKLDELIRALQGADERLLDLEELDERSLDAKREEFEQIAERARAQDGSALPATTNGATARDGGST